MKFVKLNAPYLNDHNSFLHDMVYSRFNEIQKSVHAAFRGRFYFHCASANRSYRFADEVDVHLISVPG